MTSVGWAYQTTAPGSYLLVSRLPDGALAREILIIVAVKAGMIQVRAHTSMTYSEDENYRLLRACNEWNETQSSTVATVAPKQSTELQVVVRGLLLTGPDGRAESLGRDLSESVAMRWRSGSGFAKL